MSRAEARGDQSGGELEAGLDADHHPQIIARLKLVVANDGLDGTDHLEGGIEIQRGVDRIGKPQLGVPAKLEAAPGISPLQIQRPGVEGVHIELLPDGTKAGAEKGFESHFARPPQDEVKLHGNLGQVSGGIEGIISRREDGVAAGGGNRDGIA